MPVSHPRLAFHDWPAAIYAIGDVHGCRDQLVALEQQIVADALNIEGEKWIVTLGDLVDRGPDSAGAVAQAMSPAPSGFRRFALLGNHEQIMLDFIANPAAHSYWLKEGGIETLASYGITLDYPPLRAPGAIASRLQATLPPEHLAFLGTLPICLSLPGWLFVHAGIRPGLSLAQQTDRDLIWIRAPFLTSQLTGGLRIVHGHTPGASVVDMPHRICIDTHCYQTGKLSAVRVTPDGRTTFLSVKGAPSGWAAA